MIPLRRVLILLALVPQLLVLGLGGGVYVCLDPGGAAHLQIAAKSCCEETPASSAGGAGELSGPVGMDDCQSCRDVALVADMDSVRAPDRVDHDTGSQAIALAATSVVAEERPRPPRLQRIVARDREPPNLLHLRSVVLRC